MFKYITIYHLQTNRYHRTQKPLIRKQPFGIWACVNAEKIGLGYSPAAAYTTWRDNLLANRRSPE